MIDKKWGTSVHVNWTIEKEEAKVKERKGFKELGLKTMCFEIKCKGLAGTGINKCQLVAFILIDKQKFIKK